MIKLPVFNLLDTVIVGRLRGLFLLFSVTSFIDFVFWISVNDEDNDFDDLLFILLASRSSKDGFDSISASLSVTISLLREDGWLSLII